jgi:hypothetical protein
MDAAGLSCGRHCEIAVNIYRLVEERQRCVVEVLDNGQGMADPRAQLSCFHSDKAPNALARIPNSSSSSSISYSGATCDANRSVPGSSGASGEAGALCSGKFGVGLSTCILCRSQRLICRCIFALYILHPYTYDHLLLLNCRLTNTYSNMRKVRYLHIFICYVLLIISLPPPLGLSPS